MKIPKYLSPIFILFLYLTFNACKDDCPEDTVINYPLYTEHKIFTNYDLGDSICFVSENLDTAKLFLVKMDTFTDQSRSNTDIDCGTHTIYTTAQLRSFWKGNSELLSEINIKTYHPAGSEVFFSGQINESDNIGFYLPPPFLPKERYDSLIMEGKYRIGFKYRFSTKVLLYNSQDGILKIKYLDKIWNRIY